MKPDPAASRNGPLKVECLLSVIFSPREQAGDRPARGHPPPGPRQDNACIALTKPEILGLARIGRGHLGKRASDIGSTYEPRSEIPAPILRTVSPRSRHKPVARPADRLDVLGTRRVLFEQLSDLTHEIIDRPRFDSTRHAPDLLEEGLA